MLGTGGDKVPGVRGAVGRPHPIAIVVQRSYLSGCESALSSRRGAFPKVDERLTRCGGPHGGGDRRTGMKGFKEKTFADRLQEAAEARKTALERFKSRPAADDPEVIRRREERLRIAKAREEREAVRKAQKEAEAAARAEREAAERVEREARERREAIEKVIRDAAAAAERKAARDARYAARKARQVQKKRG